MCHRMFFDALIILAGGFWSTWQHPTHLPDNLRDPPTASFYCPSIFPVWMSGATQRKTNERKPRRDPPMVSSYRIWQTHSFQKYRGNKRVNTSLYRLKSSHNNWEVCMSVSIYIAHKVVSVARWWWLVRLVTVLFMFRLSPSFRFASTKFFAGHKMS